MQKGRLTDSPSLPISVVVPVHNREDLLREAIASVQAQTCPAAELIVVDDGSTDDSARVAAEVGARVIRQHNQGSAAARNAGILSASQPWVAFLDSDDLWEPSKLEEQWALHRACPEPGLLLCDFRQVDLATGETIVPSFLGSPAIGFDALERKRIGDRWSWVPEVAHDFWKTGNFLAPPVVVARRDLLIAAGLFDPELRLAQDVEFFLRLLALTGFAMVEKSLVEVRRHAGNTSGDALALTEAFVRIAGMIAANPARYPAGAQEAYCGRLFAKKRAIGRLLLEAEHPRDARAMLEESLSIRVTARALLLWAATWMRPRMFHTLVRLRRALRRRAA